MNKAFLRIFSFVLASVLLFGLIGCVQPGDTTGTNEPTTVPTDPT